MNEYVFKRLPDNLTTLEIEGAIPNRNFFMWALNLDRKDPMATATTTYSIPLELIPGTNIKVAMDKIEDAVYLAYSVQTDTPTE
jgi:hypothetical protein